MAIVVGYVPTAEGRAALRAAAAESRMRGTGLVVIHSNRGKDLDSAEAARYEQELEAVRADLDAAGVPNEVYDQVELRSRWFALDSEVEYAGAQVTLSALLQLDASGDAHLRARRWTAEE